MRLRLQWTMAYLCMRVTRTNGICKDTFTNAIKELLERGRSKFRNVMSWYRSLTDKCKYECRGEESDLLVMTRKRKNPDGTSKETTPKAIKRGIVKWTPLHIEGEDQISHDKNIIWLQHEFKKRDKRYKLVSRKMELTYSFHRDYLRKNPVLLFQFEEKYPFLFDQQEVNNQGLPIISNRTLLPWDPRS